MLFALCITVLFLITAIVIDLGATRSDRRGGQVAVDNAASAAGHALAETNDPEIACQTAIDYLELILDTAFTGYACSDIAGCPSGGTVGATSPGYTLTLHHPVENASPLLQKPGTIGASSDPFTSDQPGIPCKRFGIELTTTGGSHFGEIVGQEQRSSTVHSVVVVEPPTDPDRLINIAVLHRTECDAILTSGAGGSGIVAEPLIDPDTGQPLPGTIAVDSNGTVGCGATVSLGGTNSLVRADGAPGCVGELNTGPGHGCGRIELFAEGAPGCNTPACHAGSGTVAPSPVRVLGQITRAPVDHKYNCKTSYALESWWAVQPIARCDSTGTRPAYIDQLKQAIGTTGTPPGFQSYRGAGYSCSIGGGPAPPVEIPVGNWHVDCNLAPQGLSLTRSLVFLGGNIVFDGNITLTADGSLTINSANTGTMTHAEGDDLNATESSSAASFIYMRNGTINMQGSSLSLNNTMAYFSATSTLDFGGGTAPVTWTAPSAGPFKELALWSDGTTEVAFAGSSGMVLDGTYFVPLATVSYHGNGGNEVTAQFIANKLLAKGNGALRLKPTRGIEVPPRPPTISLIR